ncbi:MAG: cysteine--tRNA ligase [Flammeovirgaceae bacterium]
MNQELFIYDTLSRKKVKFEPLNPPFVGIYVCGPTVYNDVHLGNCRTFTMFDVVIRYLRFIGYKVRYVRNITDVGHLVGDADEGEDKIAKKAKLENLEPMEIVQRYTVGFHSVMNMLNNLPPSVEPTATGHILEQIEMVQKLLERGMAYEVNGSVYFDVPKYMKAYSYGELSGRVVEELLANTRDLDGQDEKRHPADFALWKKASSTHIMRWNSPWGEGFPGWHLECSVMSAKYLGNTFDIHGGGMDLQFPHHECEIAQAKGTYDKAPVRYWMHANMLTVNGQKMSKSLGNSILPAELFSGSSSLLSQAYSPMVLRFCMLQTHYRSTMDITDEGLKAAQKGYLKLINGLRNAKQLLSQGVVNQENVQQDEKQVREVEALIQSVYKGMNDDFNTAIAIAGLFNILKKINLLHNGSLKAGVLGEKSFNELLNFYIQFTENVLGLLEEKPKNLEKAIEWGLEEYRQAKATKDYAKVDIIRQKFKEIGLTLKDMKDRIEWAYEEN